MSRVRTGHQPDDWTPNEPSVGRVTHTRYAIAGGVLVVGKSQRTIDTETQRRFREIQRTFVDLNPVVNPDNGAVKAPITEVHR